jgi:hypothetical protein
MYRYEQKDVEPGKVEKEANYSGLEEDERDSNCGARV